MKWQLNNIHKIYGKVVAITYLEESYRFFESKVGTISMIPLSSLDDKDRDLSDAES